MEYEHWIVGWDLIWPHCPEKIHPDTANGACVKTAVGHKPVRKP